MFKPIPSEEVYRKLLHVLVIILPLGVFYGPSLFGLDRTSLAVLSCFLLLFSILVEFLRLKNQAFGAWFYSTFGSMLREEERLNLTGATYVVAATFLCACISVLGEAFAASSCLGLTLFILGDAAAALAGKSVGLIRVGKKTLEGAIGCFLLCFLLSYWVFPMLPQFLEKWGGGITLYQALIIGASVALLELFPIKIGSLRLNDNLYVPVLVACIAVIIR